LSARYLKLYNNPMEDKYVRRIREVSKFLSGLVAANILVGLWMGPVRGYTDMFMGFTLPYGLANAWIIFDLVVLAFLIHYGWHVELPESKHPRRILFGLMGCVFYLFAVLLLLQVVGSVAIEVGGLAVPYWLSTVGVLVTGFLGYSSFHFARRK